MSKFILGDCMNKGNGLPSYPDKHFELAIVDPPYGIGQTWKKNFKARKYSDSSYKNNLKPGADYFEELFRVSKNQIIWGGNYFTDYLPPRNSWLIWDKNVEWERHHHGECEMAWTSFNLPARIIKTTWNGAFVKEKRHGKHPHEKPTWLYLWQLRKHANHGDLILDTHVGSASSLIACEQMGFEYVGYELDPDYYASAQNRMSKGIQGLLL